MTLTAWHLILFVLLGWIATLSGVALGGFLVFRTKRDRYDALFSSGAPKGEAFSLEDDGTDVVPAEIPEKIQKINRRFVDLFAENLAEKSEGRNEEGF
jgi:hypothetical protein